MQKNKFQIPEQFTDSLVYGAGLLGWDDPIGKIYGYGELKTLGKW